MRMNPSLHPDCPMRMNPSLHPDCLMRRNPSLNRSCRIGRNPSLSRSCWIGRKIPIPSCCHQRPGNPMRLHSSVHFVHCRNAGSEEKVNSVLRIFLHLSLCSEQTDGTVGLASPGCRADGCCPSDASPVQDDGRDLGSEGHGLDGPWSLLYPRCCSLPEE